MKFLLIFDRIYTPKINAAPLMRKQRITPVTVGSAAASNVCRHEPVSFLTVMIVVAQGK